MDCKCGGRMQLVLKRSDETIVGGMATAISGVVRKANTSGARGGSGALARTDPCRCSRQQPSFGPGAEAGSGSCALRPLGAVWWQGAFGCSAAADSDSVAVEGVGHRARHKLGAAKTQMPSRSTRVRFIIGSAGEMPDTQRYRLNAPSARGPPGAPDLPRTGFRGPELACGLSAPRLDLSTSRGARFP